MSKFDTLSPEEHTEPLEDVGKPEEVLTSCDKEDSPKLGFGQYPSNIRIQKTKANFEYKG